MIDVTSVDRLVRECCARFGSKTLLIDAESDRRLTFAELDLNVSRAAHVLAGTYRVRPGDRVSLFMRNSLDFFLPWLGAIRAGAIVNPINLGLENNVDRIVYMLTKLRAKVLVTEKRLDAMSRAVAKALPDLKISIIEEWRTYMESVGDEFNEVPVKPDDPFQMIFTSGTTGLPKAVVQRHEMLSDAFALTQDHFKYCEGEVAMCVLPLFHVNAQYTSFFPALALGLSLVLFEKFSASRFFPTIEKHRVAHVSVVPSLLTRLMAAGGLPTSKPPSLRFIICGAAPLTAELQKSFMETTGIPVPNGWGMTETGCWGCHSDPANIVLGSMGRALPINEMKIVDLQTGRDLPTGQTGTLVIRGKNIFREYFDAPDATSKAFRFGAGWFDTGDDVSMDARGNFFFVGRGSVDTGKVDGEFVNFLTIDEKLWTHPKFAEVCCVGVPDKIRGSVVAACVVPKPGEKIVPEEILAYAKTLGLAKWETPAYALVVDDIPKGDTGKLQRRVMTERAIKTLGF